MKTLGTERRAESLELTADRIRNLAADVRNNKHDTDEEIADKLREIIQMDNLSTWTRLREFRTFVKKFVSRVPSFPAGEESV